MSEYVDSLRASLRALKPRPVPAPWKRVSTALVGGLWSVGFAPGTDLLLVVSADGRGVIDCRTGERVARDRDSASESWFDPISLTADGIGPLAGQSVRIGGLHGGGLPLTTEDHWVLQVFSPDWPDVMLLLEPPGCNFVFSRNAERCVRIDALGAGQFRAAGFSPTGKTLIVATSADIDIFARS